MENYFVVLHLPGGKRLKVKEGNKSSEHFWNKAVHAIGSGKARLISRRQDTGATDDIRLDAAKARRFKTYVVLNVLLDSSDAVDKIFKKAAKHLSGRKKTTTIIETAENYQLLTVES